MDWSARKQRAVLSAIFTGKLELAPQDIDPSLWTDIRVQIVEKASRFRKDRGEWPLIEALPDLFPELKPRGRKELADELSKMRSLRDSEVYEHASTARVALRQEALRIALLEASEVVEEENPDSWLSLPSRLRTALTVGEDSGHRLDYRGAVDQRYGSARQQKLVPCGLPAIDEAMGGGLAPGEMGLIMAPTSRGKSQFAIHFGAHALKQNIPCLFVSLEMSGEECARRFDRSLTNLTLEEIEEDIPDFQRRLDATGVDLTKLRLLSYPKYRLSVPKLEDELKRAMDFWGEPPLLVIDYIGLMHPDKQDARYLEIGYLVANVNALGQEYKLPIWSPWQTNREGDDLTNIADSYDVAKHVAEILALKQTPRLESKNEMDVVSAKARTNAGGTERVRYDWTRNIIEPGGVDANSPVNPRAADQPRPLHRVGT